METENNNPESSAKPTTLENVFDSFFTQLEGLEEVVPVVSLLVSGYQRTKVDDLWDFLNQFKSEQVGNERKFTLKSKDISEALLKTRELRKSVHAHQICMRSLFIGTFALFDGFINDLLRFILNQKKQFPALEDKEIKISDILKFTSIDEIRSSVIDKTISSIIRESYEEQFKRIGQLFKMNLEEYPKSWPRFIEASQRRNLVVHCNGRVSEQYLLVCKRAGVDFGETPPQLDSKLSISRGYLLDSIEILHEIALKLGTAVVRKALPEQLKDDDAYLGSHLYRLLENEKWEQAQMVGRYALELPKHSSNECKRRIAVNYAQALKWSGDEKGCKEVINNFDWSDVSIPFAIAKAALEDSHDLVWQLLKDLTDKSDWKVHLKEWPLFSALRKQRNFQKKYSELFGEPFVEAIRREARSEATIVSNALAGMDVILKEREEQKETKQTKGRNSPKLNGKEKAKKAATVG